LSSVCNLTLAWIVPKSEGAVQAEETAHILLQKWMDSRFRYDDVEQRYASGFPQICFTAFNGHKITQVVQIDFALLVVPPFMNYVHFTNAALTCSLAASYLVMTIFQSLHSKRMVLPSTNHSSRMPSQPAMWNIVETSGNETYNFETAKIGKFLGTQCDRTKWTKIGQATLEIEAELSISLYCNYQPQLVFSWPIVWQGP
jgi:hypothetical protein